MLPIQMPFLQWQGHCRRRCRKPRLRRLVANLTPRPRLLLACPRATAKQDMLAKRLCSNLPVSSVARRAGHGIGAMTSLLLARQGAKVISVSNVQENCDTVTAAIKEEGNEGLSFMACVCWGQRGCGQQRRRGVRGCSGAAGDAGRRGYSAAHAYNDRRRTKPKTRAEPRPLPPVVVHTNKRARRRIVRTTRMWSVFAKVCWPSTAPSIVSSTPASTWRSPRCLNA